MLMGVGVQCLQSATSVVRQLCDVHAPSGYLKYAPDCYFVMGGFSAAFLLKVSVRLLFIHSLADNLCACSCYAPNSRRC